MKILTFIGMVLAVSVSMATDGEVQAPGFLHQIESFLGGLVGGIPTDGTVLLLVAFLVEGLVRLVKTDKPKSILLVAAKSMEVAARIFELLAIAARKLSDLANKVVPQRLKDDTKMGLPKP